MYNIGKGGFKNMKNDFFESLCLFGFGILMAAIGNIFIAAIVFTIVFNGMQRK